MKRILVIILFSILALPSFGQSGYLGSLNSISAEVNMVPSIRKTYRLNNAMDEATIRQRFTYASYRFTYSRIINKNIELSIGYRFAQAYAPTYGTYYAYYDTLSDLYNNQYLEERKYNFLEDPKFTIHGFLMDFKYYRLGSVSPVGKYIGLSLEYGFTTLGTDQDIIVGKRDVATKDNFLFSKHSLLESEIVKVADDVKASVTSLYALIGRNYPITKNLMINVGMRFPIMTYIISDGNTYYGFNIDDDPYYYTSESSFNHLVGITLKKYTRLSFNAGLSFHF